MKTPQNKKKAYDKQYRETHKDKERLREYIRDYKNLETYEHKIRLLYPEGFVFQRGTEMYQVIFNEIAKNDIKTCSYAEFMAWRTLGNVKKIITPGKDGTTIDDILKDSRILPNPDCIDLFI